MSSVLRCCFVFLFGIGGVVKAASSKSTSTAAGTSASGGGFFSSMLNSINLKELVDGPGADSAKNPQQGSSQPVPPHQQAQQQPLSIADRMVPIDPASKGGGGIAKVLSSSSLAASASLPPGAHIHTPSIPAPVGVHSTADGMAPLPGPGLSMSAPPLPSMYQKQKAAPKSTAALPKGVPPIPSAVSDGDSSNLSAGTTLLEPSPSGPIPHSLIPPAINIQAVPQGVSTPNIPFDDEMSPPRSRHHGSQPKKITPRSRLPHRSDQDNASHASSTAGPSLQQQSSHQAQDPATAFPSYQTMTATVPSPDLSTPASTITPQADNGSVPGPQQLTADHTGNGSRQHRREHSGSGSQWIQGPAASHPHPHPHHHSQSQSLFNDEDRSVTAHSAQTNRPPPLTVTGPSPSLGNGAKELNPQKSVSPSEGMTAPAASKACDDAGKADAQRKGSPSKPGLVGAVRTNTCPVGTTCY
jgi:hypothetical protein